jgi:hypothetical protein
LGVVVLPDFSFAPIFSALYASLIATFRSRAALQREILALRHQLGALHRSVKRPKLNPADRFLWASLCAVWNDWRSNIFLVKASTVINWHRKGFRLFWTVRTITAKMFPGEPIAAINSIGFVAREYPYSSAQVIVHHTVEMAGRTETIWTDTKGNLFQPTCLMSLR